MERGVGGPVFTGVSEQIAIHGRFRPREIALIEGERRLTWVEYNLRANAMASRLAALGVRRGERIAMLVANRLFSHEALLAIWRCGAVAVPLPTMLNAAQLQVMVKDSGAVALVSSAEFEGLGREAAPALPMLTEAALDDAALEKCDVGFLPHACARDELAVIIYSSGTTGVPKGIAHTHGSRLSFAVHLASEFRFHPRCIALSAIPMHSNGAWLSWLPANLVGGATLLLPTFSTAAYLELVREHAPTHGFIVPTMASGLLQHPNADQVSLKCFEALISAGSPLPAAVKRGMQSLTGHALYELWGLTEGIATIIDPHGMKLRPDSVGRPMQGCDIRLLDEEDRDVTFAGCGEIVGYSSGMMSGYWNRPDADAAALWRDARGTRYLRTGDLGQFDADGLLTLRGRKKDMILSGGMNVYPVDIEARLLELAGVQEAAVFGIEDPKWGEVPVALVYIRPGTPIDIPGLLDAANSGLARHQRIKKLVVWDTPFPRNSMGKIPKPELREAYLKNARDGL